MAGQLFGWFTVYFGEGKSDIDQVDPMLILIYGARVRDMMMAVCDDLLLSSG